MARALTALTTHWVLVAFALSLGTALLGWLVYDVSPLHPVEEVAQRQQERRLKQRMVERHLHLGKRFLDVGRRGAAEAQFQAALKLEPASARAHLGLLKSRIYATVASGQYEPEVIRKRIDLILEEDRDDPHAHLFLGDLYSRLAPKQAAAEYRRALDIDPQVAAAHFGLGSLRFWAGDLAAAHEQFQGAVAISPWNQDYLDALALVDREQSRYPQAIAGYHKLLELDSEYLLAYCELGQTYRRRGEENDLKKARWYQEQLLHRLEDERISALEKNRGPWLFRGKKGPIALYDLAEKRCYGRYDLAVTLSLLHRKGAAARNLEQARGLPVAREAAIRELVTAQVEALLAKHPKWSGSLGPLRERYLSVDGR